MFEHFSENFAFPPFACPCNFCTKQGHHIEYDKMWSTRYLAHEVALRFLNMGGWEGGRLKGKMFERMEINGGRGGAGVLTKKPFIGSEGFC